MVRVLPLMGAVAALALFSQLLSVVLYDAPQPTPTLLLREIGKAAVTDPQEEAERRLQHYAAKGFNDFMRMLERRYGSGGFFRAACPRRE